MVIASCRRCNAILHSKLFNSLEEKRGYIQQELRRRGEWQSAEEMRSLQKAVPSKQTMAEILPILVPLAVLGQKESENTPKRRANLEPAPRKSIEYATCPACEVEFVKKFSFQRFCRMLICKIRRTKSQKTSFQEWAVCYDHILPVSHGGTNRKSNLYPGRLLRPLESFLLRSRLSLRGRQARLNQRRRYEDRGI